MFRNYVKIALRNISKHKFFSAINLLGMTTGITASLLIILWVTDELSYDKFHKDGDRIYQVGLKARLGGQSIRTATTCPPMAAALVNEFPEVESATRLTQYYNEPVIRFDDQVLTQDRVFYADSNFLQFFTFELLQGDTKTALREPNSVVLTKSVAEKFFGNESALGRTFSIDDPNSSYKVTAVLADPPATSHFDFNLLISSSSFDRLKEEVWLSNWMFSYFKLKPGASVKGVEEKFPSLVVKYVGPEMERLMGISMSQMGEGGGDYGFFATKITDIHFDSETANSILPGGNIMHVYIFSAIGIFILIIACINFMNLTTARSAGRAKEVGLRKTLGSFRRQLIAQFLAESLIYSLVAVVLAVIACYSLLPSFNVLSGKELKMEMFFGPEFAIGVASLIILVGVVAGSYPAFYLTSFNAVEVLKGKVRAGMKSKGVRSTLVVFQFFVSILLIIFTFVIYEQIQFMHEKNIGLDKQNVLIIQNVRRLENNAEAFRNKIEQQNGVLESSFTNNTFPGVNNTTVFRSAGSEQDHIMGNYYADYNHVDVLKLELAEGRNFSKDFPSDTAALIINEAAAREFGFDNAVGEEIIYTSDARAERLKIIGVVKNFNFESFKTGVRPISIRLTTNANNILVRYQGSATEVVENVSKVWKETDPNQPFEYSFLDQEFDSLFRAEQRMGVISTIFSGLAIFIACLGLFALAAFTAEQRTKEIGIRKALGASTFNLVYILSKEFTILVTVAFLPAAVCAWYFANEWLAGFAHRIDIDPVVFILSGVGAIVVAWLTVGYQAVKAAATNPVKSLRYE